MRTTLTIDDGIARELKARAHRTGQSFKSVVNDTLRRGLREDSIGEKTPIYRIKAESMGKPAPGVDLVKALALADGIEDEELRNKLILRK